MAITLLMSFSSCSNDDDSMEKNDNSGSKNIYLKISRGLATYAEGVSHYYDNRPIEEIIKLNSGNLYFTNKDGNIKRHFFISSDVTSVTNINIATLMNKGVTIADIPGDVKKVYIVGNTSDLPTAGNISIVKEKVLKIQSQVDLSNVNLYGEADAIDTQTISDDTKNKLYKAEIALVPTVARIELPSIIANCKVITGFKVAGIFIDNYYSTANVDGTVVANILINNESNPAAFGGKIGGIGETAEYPATLNPAIYDWFKTPIEAELTDVYSQSLYLAKPTADNKVWVYNVFAAPKGSAVPRIIVRLTDITTDPKSGIEYKVDQYITVRGFTIPRFTRSSTRANDLESNNSHIVTMFEPGSIYHILSIDFDEKNLSPIPNLKPIDVQVSVKIASWERVDVTPQL